LVSLENSTAAVSVEEERAAPVRGEEEEDHAPVDDRPRAP
jgi:hypothetical protein